MGMKVMIDELELDVAMDEDTRFLDVLYGGASSDCHVKVFAVKLIHFDI
jgi:hypothetical protein